jgi:hypothetical protein
LSGYPDKATRESLRISGFASPNHGDAPALLAEGGAVAGVACGIAFQFGEPEFAACGGHGGFAAIRVPVPEAAVDENDEPARAQHDVRLSGQSGAVETKAQSHGVEEPAHDQFRCRVLAADARHVP